MSQRDPYRYYRIEARELVDGLAGGVLAIAAHTATPDAVGKLLRQAHTLKGAARVVRQSDTGERAHAFEELLEPFRASGGTLTREQSDALLALVDAMRQDIETLGQTAAPAAAPTAAPAATPAAPPAAVAPARPVVATAAPAPARPAVASAPPAPSVEKRFASVRIDATEMDRLLEEVTVASVRVERLRRELAELQAVQRGVRTLANGTGRSIAGAATLAASFDGTLRAMAQGVDQSARGLVGIQEQINALRLLPAETVFGVLERAVYDVAGALGKDVRFQASGGEQKLEAHVLAPLYDALLHVVRNAVDHGLEDTATRLAAGKPAQGRIELSVERRGSRIAVIARDDGRGVDVEAVRRKALASGRLDAAQADALDLDGAIALLIRGGLSTKAEASDISGRGIGLDAVRDVALRLKGELRVSSDPGRGLRVEIEVPASLSRLPALLLQLGEQVYSIPLTAVERALRVSRADLGHSQDGDTVTLGDEVLPFARLGPLLGATGSARDGERSTGLLLRSRHGRAVVTVDRLLGQSEILLRPLPASLGLLDLFMGASLDADGDPQPMLDADGVVQAVIGGRGRHAVAPVRARPRILVIDDSLTTRMLEQSILESAGFEVALATSGEEGLAMARQRSYDLFITDVEMPGMTGFDFIRATRADAKLREVPGIVVSSLHSDADKARGAEVGARAYIVKGEFEQGRFLDTVRSLVG